MTDFKTFIDSRGKLFRVVETTLSPEWVYEHLWKYSVGSDYEKGHKARNGSLNIADSGTDYIFNLETCKKDLIEALRKGEGFKIVFDGENKAEAFDGKGIELFVGKELDVVVKGKHTANLLYIHTENPEALLVGFYVFRDKEDKYVDSLTKDEVTLIERLGEK